MNFKNKIDTPFAQNGIRDAVPETDPQGDLNYSQGYTADYQKSIDLGGRMIKMSQYNEVLHRAYAAIKELQDLLGTAATLNVGLNSGEVPIYGTNQTITGNVSGTASTALSLPADRVHGVLSIPQGGTGAATAPSARSNLGLGTAATHNVGTNAGQVPTYGVAQVLNGNVSGTAKTITDILGVEKGGTGANSLLSTAKNLKFMRYGGWRPEWNNDANKVNESCVLRDYSCKNSPAGLVNGQLITFYDGDADTMGQLYIYHDRGVIFVRSAKGAGTDWSAWKYLYGDKDIIPIANGGTGQGSIPDFVKIASAASGNITIPAGGTWYCLVFSAGANGMPAFSHTGGGGTQIPNSGVYLVHSYAICFRIL